MIRRFAVVVAIAAVSCTDDLPPPAPTTAAPTASIEPAQAELDGLLRGLTACELDAKGAVASNCPAGKAHSQWLRSPAATGPNAWRAAEALLGDEHPAVRAGAVSAIAPAAKATPEARRALLARVDAETLAALRTHVVRTIGRSGDAPELRAALVGAAKHADPEMRREAIGALGAPAAPPRPGPERDAMLGILASDPVEALRRYACWRMGIGDDVTILGAIEQVLGDPKTSPELYADCVYGLALAFDPTIPMPSKAAYEALVGRLEKGPRGRAHPYGTAIGQLTYLEVPNPKLPFYDEERVLAAVRVLARDKKALEDDRAAAMSMLLLRRPNDMAKLGVPSDEVRRLIDARAERAQKDAAVRP